MTSYALIEAFADEIAETYERTEAKEEFLPDDRLQCFVTREKVMEMLQAAGISTADMTLLLDFIFEQDAKRLFVILVLMSSSEQEKLSLMNGLREDGVTDASLPLNFENDKANNRWIGIPLESLVNKPYEVFNKWGRRDRDSFRDYQYRIAVPLFSERQFHYRFTKQRVLPFLGVASKPSSSGFFGEVSLTEIHPAHIPVLTKVRP
jgi:hypothetical protein